MDRECMIAACRKVLPYPISFYDRLSDGSLWNVYNKHVVLGIPIDKKVKKAKAENDKARAEEAKQMENNQQPKPKKRKTQQDTDFYHQISIDEYTELMQPQKPKIIQNGEDGTWWRLNDMGEYDLIPDSELQDVLEAFGCQPQEEVLLDIDQPGLQLTLRRKIPYGGSNRR